MTDSLAKRLRVAAATCSEWRLDRMRPPLDSWAILMDEAADLIDSFIEEDDEDPEPEWTWTPQNEHTAALNAWISATGDDVEPAKERLQAARLAYRNSYARPV